MACRRCGKRQRVNPRMVLLGLAVVFVAGMFAFAAVGSSLLSAKVIEAAPFMPRERSASAVTTGSPVAVSAGELWDAYERDAIAADRLYRDRPIRLTGRVVAVPVRDFRGHLVLRLGTNETLESVRATLASRSSVLAASVGKGQAITLLCTGRGALIGAPIMDGCVFE